MKGWRRSALKIIVGRCLRDFLTPRLSAFGSGCSDCQRRSIGLKASSRRASPAPTAGGQSARGRAFRTRHDSPRQAAGYRTRPKSLRQAHELSHKAGSAAEPHDWIASRAGGCFGMRTTSLFAARGCGLTERGVEHAPFPRPDAHACRNRERSCAFPSVVLRGRSTCNRRCYC
jgi:hypothetical protein